METNELIEHIDALAELEENWDSYGSAPISLLAVVTAKNIVKGWNAVPMNGGGIQLEVHAPGAEVEIEIGPDGRVSWAGAFDEDNNLLK